ncbi:MAG: cyclic nucleotide-binding domain-containing protein [Rhodocyclaceae bacterium]|nr:cyclic nucleotide-binding domain-containing protein [Rhodocyclaceae bacterium]MBX3670293.1 cyclic nucleotide-binding domain-containing protein [Rhodocyclaceae bacterium]
MPFFFKPVDPAGKFARLRRLRLFSTLTLRELQVVETLYHERSFLKDEIIFDEGEEGQALYAILNGELLVLRRFDATPVTLARLGPGDFFGEMALLDQAPRQAQVRAASDCELLVFFRADFMQLLQTHPRVASKISLQLARHLAQRVREANQGRRMEGHL